MSKVIGLAMIEVLVLAGITIMVVDMGAGDTLIVLGVSSALTAWISTAVLLIVKKS